MSEGGGEGVRVVIDWTPITIVVRQVLKAEVAQTAAVCVERRRVSVDREHEHKLRPCGHRDALAAHLWLLACFIEAVFL